MGILFFSPAINNNPYKETNILYLRQVLPITALAHFFLQEKPRSLFLSLVSSRRLECHPFSLWLFTFPPYIGKQAKGRLVSFIAALSAWRFAPAM